MCASDLGQITHMTAQGVARFHNSVGRKPSFHARHACTNAIHALGEQTVGDAWEAVLFLNQGGNSHPYRLVQQGATRKSANTDDHVGSMFAQKLTRSPQAADEFQGEGQVAKACQGAVEAADPKAGDGVARGRNFLHFHPAEGAHKVNVRLWMAFLDFVGDGQRWMDVAAGSSP